MATRFELVLPGEDEVALRAAGEEALDEIERLENQLSLYRPGSDIAQVNAEAADRPVRVSPAIFQLLKQAGELSELSAGAFDITVGPLVRCWGFMKGTGRVPTAEEIEAARAQVGMHLVELDEARFTVRFRRAGVMLDLGSIGKGYAIDRAMEILAESGVENALLHGGTSTVQALGENPGEGPWKISIEPPPASEDEPPPAALAVVPLKNEALSVSAVWGKSFTHEGKTFGHLIDPRTGWPAAHGLLAAVVFTSAMETDALSTAVLLNGEEQLAEITTRLPGLRWLRLSADAGARRVASHGIDAAEGSWAG